MRLTPITAARRHPLFASLTVLLCLAGTQAFADDDPCSGFKWDVSKERALFASTAVATAAGKDAASAPAVTSNRLYQLQLLPTSQVSFAVPPGKTSPLEGTYAGEVTLSIPAPGSYRVSIDLPLWIDVVAGGKLLSPTDYEGLHSCNAPRKIVEFALDGKQPLILQLSGAGQTTVRLTIVRTAA
jgi:hypothetical protein